MPRRLAYKGGVRITKRTPALDIIENAALQTQEELGYPEELCVTSINDSSHGTHSKHWRELAEDFRTSANGVAARAKNDMGTTTRKQKFRKRFEENCGARFRVILEAIGTSNEHLHAQLKKGLEEYP